MRGGNWRKHDVGLLPYACEAIAADINGDGRMEIIATAWAPGNQVVWFEHGGDPTVEWTQHIKQCAT